MDLAPRKVRFEGSQVKEVARLPRSAFQPTARSETVRLWELAGEEWSLPDELRRQSAELSALPRDAALEAETAENTLLNRAPRAARGERA
jgi:uncharacterized protein YhaN